MCVFSQYFKRSAFIQVIVHSKLGRASTKGLTANQSVQTKAEEIKAAQARRLKNTSM
jgi:hypothetical protein